MLCFVDPSNSSVGFVTLKQHISSNIHESLFLWLLEGLLTWTLLGNIWNKWCCCFSWEDSLIWTHYYSLPHSCSVKGKDSHMKAQLLDILPWIFPLTCCNVALALFGLRDYLTRPYLDLSVYFWERGFGERTWGQAQNPDGSDAIISFLMNGVTFFWRQVF